jgi:Virulence factor BrkB
MWLSSSTNGKSSEGCGRAALTGAIVTALLLRLISLASGWIYERTTRLSVVYGSLTSALVFLYSMYLYSSALLLGAEVAAAWSRPRREDGAPILTELKRGLLGLLVTQKVSPDDQPNRDAGPDQSSGPRSGPNPWSITVPAGGRISPRFVALGASLAERGSHTRLQRSFDSVRPQRAPEPAWRAWRGCPGLPSVVRSAHRAPLLGFSCEHSLEPPLDPCRDFFPAPGHHHQMRAARVLDVVSLRFRFLVLQRRRSPGSRSTRRTSPSCPT